MGGLRDAVSWERAGAPLSSRRYHAIVVGLGGMGSAAAYHLARRGLKVLGLDRFTPPHPYGSSHGVSRIIRLAYFEHPDYVPLLRRAYELWEELAHETGRELLVRTGGLMIGPPEGVLVTGCLRSAREHGLPYELLDWEHLRRRFPVLQPEPGTVAVWEPEAGYVRAEESVRAHLERAAALGAELRFGEPVQAWRADGEGVEVRTASDTYRADRLVLTVGPWARELLGLDLPLEVTRQVMFWFAPDGDPAPFLPSRFPVFLWELGAGHFLYGFPALEGPESGVKVAFHRRGDACHPDTVDRQVREAEVAEMRACLRARIPALGAGSFLRAVPCLYTNTPDSHFVLGLHPRYPQVAVMAGCSGHGFKFCSVIGEVLADLVTTGRNAFRLELFHPGRFAG